MSVAFADRTIEVSEGVGQVTVCLLKNSTTAMDFSVTVASVESSPVSAEGLYRESWAESVRFLIISVSLCTFFPQVVLILSRSQGHLASQMEMTQPVQTLR